MGLFKKLFGIVDDELKKSLEEDKKPNVSKQENKSVPTPEAERKPKPKKKPTAKASKTASKKTSKKKAPIAASEGVFSPRLESLIQSALKDGVLTDKEREIIKKRAEAEGEDWDEVEMLLDARLEEIESKDNAIPKATNKKDTSKPDGKINKQGYIIDCENIKHTMPITQAINEEEYLLQDWIKKVVFPSSITSIGRKAFSACKNLEEVDFCQCDSLEEIGESAFQSCNKINRITLPKSLKRIGDSAFQFCYNLEEIDFSQCYFSLEKIGIDAFRTDNSKLVIDFSQFVNLKEIGWGAFFDIHNTDIDLSKCPGLKLPSSFHDCFLNGIKSASLSLDDVPDEFFINSNNLEKVDLSKSTKLTRIGKRAFLHLLYLRELSLPDTVETFGIAAFARLDLLKHFVMPSSIKEMGREVFAYSGMVSIDFSKVSQLSTLPDLAFYECHNLKSIRIPDSVQEIGDGVFNNCENLREIIMPSSLVEIGKDFYSSQISRLEIIDFSKVRSLEIIPYHFLSCDSIKSLIIPMGVRKIEDNAFKVSKLKQMFLPPTLETIGKYGNYNHDVYCFAPKLDELESFADGLEENQQVRLYVMPQYIEAYLAQRKAEGISENNLSIQVIPEEYLYYYEN